jgi:quinol monooxygenase YgiN
MLNFYLTFSFFNELYAPVEIKNHKKNNTFVENNRIILLVLQKFFKTLKLVKMNFRLIVIVCAALMMAACCGNSGKKSAGQAEEKSCPMSASAKSCSMTCGEKPACTAAGAKKIIGAQLFIKADKVDAFLEFSKDLIVKSRAEEGCISYTLYQDPNDKTKFFFFEEWKNQAAIDFHFSTEHFKQLGEKLKDWEAAPAIITVY